MKPSGRARSDIASLLTIAAAITSGALAAVLGLPLPWLLGPLFCAAGLALSGATFLDQPAQFPQSVRNLAVPVIGVMIGASITPEVAREMVGWWPSLLTLVPAVVALQMVNYAVLRNLGGYDRPTAFFAASPGGLVEAALLGEKEGGSPPLISLQHLCRIALSVITIPLIFHFVIGQAVGSAAGAVFDAPKEPLNVTDTFVLVACGAVGLAIGKKLCLPAAIMVGPMLISALLHMTGLSTATVPQIIATAAQIAIGTVIGLRFAGQSRIAVLIGLRLAILTVAVSMGLSGLVAWILSATGVADWKAIFLAFAPGGIAEMGLIAISLEISPIYVTTHHVVRIMIAVALSRILFKALHRYFPVC